LLYLIEKNNINCDHNYIDKYIHVIIILLINYIVVIICYILLRKIRLIMIIYFLINYILVIIYY